MQVDAHRRLFTGSIAQLAQDIGGDGLQLLERTIVPDHEVRLRSLRGGIHLRSHDTSSLARADVPQVHEAAKPLLIRRFDDHDTVEVSLQTGLEEQRDLRHDERRALRHPILKPPVSKLADDWPSSTKRSPRAFSMMPSG